MNASLIVVHEDADCLAVVKPAGQFTQGTWAPPGERTLEQCVRSHLDPADPDTVYLGIVHRLDRPTSGVLLWAKTEKAARRLSSQFERRQVVKEYWAIVESSTLALSEDSERESEQASGRDNRIDTSAVGGEIEPIWTDWLTRADRSGVVHAVSPGTPGARVAITTVELAQAVRLPEGCEWLRLRPQTGRTHQLRVQAARRGRPIVGDSIYGSASRIFTPEPIIALHAYKLTLRHPTLQHEMTLMAPVPEVWERRGIELMAPNR